MGYKTEFRGEFELDKPLKPEHKKYLEHFNESRRMKRDAEKAEKLKDPVRLAAKLPIGEEGAYYVGSANADYGQNDDVSVIEHNYPPGHIDKDPSMKNWEKRYTAEKKRIRQGKQQPSLWCQWMPNKDGTAIIWDEGEKFYEYVPWIQYIIDHFLEPWGYKLTGTVEWRGEEWDDQGTITIVNNKISSPKYA